MNYCSATSGTTGATTIVQLPLAFVRSGGVYLDYGYVNYVGERGYPWSRTAKSSRSAYYLWMTSTDVNPSGYYSRWNGFPLRCRTRTSEEKSGDDK